MHRRIDAVLALSVAFLVGVGLLASYVRVEAKASLVEHCPWKGGLLISEASEGEEVELVLANQDCVVPANTSKGPWVFGNVHILAGGTLRFSDAKIDFWAKSILVEKGVKRIGPFFIPSMIVNLAPGQLSIKYGLKGPNYSPVSACATGNHSLGDAMMIIQRGMADVMLAGSAEATISPNSFWRSIGVPGRKTVAIRALRFS